MAFQSPRHSQSFYQHDASTPPPPPPKPGNSSGTATPSTGPPLPPPPGQTQPYGSSQLAYSQGQPQDGPHQLVIQPPNDGWLPEYVKDKATKDLHEILQSQELQHAIVHGPETAHESLRASMVPLQALLAQNVQLAESLKQLEAHVQHQRDGTQSRLLALRALERQWKTKQTEQDEALREFSPPALYQRLNAAVGEQEALCRGLEESFLEGEGVGGHDAVASEREVVDFVRRIREGRKVAYLRAERKERWDEGRAQRKHLTTPSRYYSPQRIAISAAHSLIKMTSTTYFGNRFQRKLKPFNLRFRSSRRGRTSLFSTDSSVNSSDVQDAKEEEIRKANVEVDVSKLVECRQSGKGRAAALHQTSTPAFNLAHARNEQTLSRLRLENLLREQAIHLVSLTYSGNLSTGPRFDVYTTMGTDIVLSGKAVDTYVTRAIVFADPRSSRWHVIKQGVGRFVTVAESLEAFIRDLRSNLETRSAQPSRRWAPKNGSASSIDQILIDLDTRSDVVVNPFEPLDT
ncbi:hypothetical protein OPT61_g1912 [Boeremia exigua]|uniref:Uncharacterized protein n=1 Tax=Boeremia exigua TaxID=749465 RepID=A0ACC2INN4_9PLEO|nr:hypothetical protein OPT61_g1912 [Boeremia exigua]